MRGRTLTGRAGPFKRLRNKGQLTRTIALVQHGYFSKTFGISRVQGPKSGVSVAADSTSLESLSGNRRGVDTKVLARKWSVLEGAVVGIPLTAFMTMRSMVVYDINKVSSARTLNRWHICGSEKPQTEVTGAN